MKVFQIDGVKNQRIGYQIAIDDVEEWAMEMNMENPDAIEFAKDFFDSIDADDDAIEKMVLCCSMLAHSITMTMQHAFESRDFKNSIDEDINV